jgi:hypothetical protein
MDVSRIKTVSVRFIGYLSYISCSMTTLLGLYTFGSLVFTGAQTGQIYGSMILLLLACSGGSLLLFAVGRAIFTAVNHPSWILDLRETRDSILYR